MDFERRLELLRLSGVNEEEGSVMRIKRAQAAFLETYIRPILEKTNKVELGDYSMVVANYQGTEESSLKITPAISLEWENQLESGESAWHKIEVSVSTPVATEKMYQHGEIRVNGFSISCDDLEPQGDPKAIESWGRPINSHLFRRENYWKPLLENALLREIAKGGKTTDSVLSMKTVKTLRELYGNDELLFLAKLKMAKIEAGAEMKKKEAKKRKELNEQLEQSFPEKYQEALGSIKKDVPVILGKINTELFQGNGTVFGWEKEHTTHEHTESSLTSSGHGVPDGYTSWTWEHKFTAMVTRLTVPKIGEVVVFFEVEKQGDEALERNPQTIILYVSSNEKGTELGVNNCSRSGNTRQTIAISLHYQDKDFLKELEGMVLIEALDLYKKYISKQPLL